MKSCFYVLVSLISSARTLVLIVIMTMDVFLTADTRCWNTEDDTSYDSVGPRVKAVM